MKITTVSCLFAAAVLSAAVSHAQQVVSHYAEVALGGDTAQNLSVPGFDSTLGTLTEVKLTFTGEIWQSVFGENLAATASSFDLSSTTELRMVKANGPLLFSPGAATLQRTGTVSAFDGVLDFGGPSGLRFTQTRVISGIYIDPQLEQYLAGPVAFSAEARNSSVLNAANSFGRGAAWSANAGLSVDYTYAGLAAIPEPSVYAAIMGGAALACLTLRRRRILHA